MQPGHREETMVETRVRRNLFLPKNIHASIRGTAKTDFNTITLRRRTLLSMAAATASTLIAGAQTIRGDKPPPSPKLGDLWINERDESTLLYVPAGNFLMGAASEDAGDENEKPQHVVYLDGYWIGKYPITNDQLRRFQSVTGLKTDAERDRQRSRHLLTGSSSTEWDDYPAAAMSWWDAVTYCNWAGLRIPTEAEWEKAARGTDGRRYPWGNQDDPQMYLSNPNDKSKSFVGLGQRLPVTYFDGRGAGSPYGMMCASSHLTEWCWDYYDPHAYSVMTAPRNPMGPVEPKSLIYVNDVPEGQHVVRGGPGAPT